MKVLTPILKLLRLTDGKKGATLGAVFGLMKDVERMFSKAIKGVPVMCGEKLLALWQGRLAYFFKFPMFAAYCFEPRYCRKMDFIDCEIDDAIMRCFKTIAKNVETVVEMIAEFTEYRSDLDLGLEMPSEKWASFYLAKYKRLVPVVRRLLALTGSAWSIEGWIHSKKRNRLGQKNVSRLVRVHTNLHLQSLLADWKPNVLPWDI